MGRSREEDDEEEEDVAEIAEERAAVAADTTDVEGEGRSEEMSEDTGAPNVPSCIFA